MNLTNPILAQRVAVMRTLVDRLQSLDEELQLPMFLALSDVAALTGMSEPTLRRMELCGEFPLRVNIGPRRKGVALRDYIEWVAKRRAGLAGADGATQTVEGKSAIGVAAGTVTQCGAAPAQPASAQSRHRVTTAPQATA